MEVFEYGRDGEMDRRQEFFGIDEKVRAAVKEAVEAGNFRPLNEIVKSAAGTALEGLRGQAGQVLERSGIREVSERIWEEQSRSQRAKVLKKLERQYMNKNSRAPGIMLTVFGGIGIGILGLLTGFFLLCYLLSLDGTAAFVTVFFALFLAVSAFVLKKGCWIQARLKRAERYLQLMFGELYVETSELAARTGQKEEGLRKDLRGMLKAGIFPEGHMDAKERFFILDDGTWEYYLTVSRQWREEQTAKAAHTEAGQESEAKRMLQEGQAYIGRLRRQNTEISGAALLKLYRLEELLERILDVLKEHPEKCPQMRKFMDYYLPMTTGLVESYADFEKAGLSGGHVQEARTEIEITLDTISQAFEKFLEELYQEAIFEASADAKVLKTILAQDGYAEHEFSTENRREGTM